MKERLEIRRGDIATAGTDAIVNAWNRNFIPHWLLLPRGVSRALRRAAGNEPFREVRRHGLLAVGQAVATGAGRLEGTRYIIHVAALHATWSSSESAVRAGAKNALALARELEVASLAIPLLGAGTGGVAPHRSFALIREAFEALREPPRTEVWIWDPVGDLHAELAAEAVDSQ